MNNIKNLRIQRIISGLMVLMLTSVPLSKNLNTKKHFKDGKCYMKAYENKTKLADDSTLWIDMSEEQEEIIKKKKKVLNKYF